MKKQQLDAMASYGHAQHVQQREYNDRRDMDALVREQKKLKRLGYIPFPRYDFPDDHINELVQVALEAKLELVDLGHDGRIDVWIKPDAVDALKTLMTITRKEREQLKQIDESTRATFEQAKHWKPATKEQAEPTRRQRMEAVNETRAQHGLPRLRIKPPRSADHGLYCRCRSCE